MFNINAPHWHLLINHIPVVGMLFAVPLTIWALIRNSIELKRASLVFYILIGIATFFSNYTGGPAARSLSNMPGITKADIRAHSQSADISLIVTSILAVLALVTLIVAARRKNPNPIMAGERRNYKEPPMGLMVLCLLIGLADIGVLSWTSNLGGNIRHPEIRTDSLSRSLPAAAPIPGVPAPSAVRDNGK